MRATVKIFQSELELMAMRCGVSTPPFDSFSTGAPGSPVVLSVPHAGRDYPPCDAMLRVPVARLVALEDRHADLLAAHAVARGTPVFVARTPRLWIDLNRAESDLDFAMAENSVPPPHLPSAKVRGGLGLIPRRLPGISEIWSAKLGRTDVEARIATVHRPYHAAIAGALAAARIRYGAALLLDLHSMPSINTPAAPDVVIGDRFGTISAPQLTASAEAVLSASGLRVAINAPYAGGYIVARHARPAEGIHALQIEFDRRLYLDGKLDSPGPGLLCLQQIVMRLVAVLTDELLAASDALAAE